MRNTLKATTLESKLPLLAVEHGCIISKDADITVAFEVSLPELFTVTSQEYEAMHAAWCKACLLYTSASYYESDCKDPRKSFRYQSAKYVYFVHNTVAPDGW